MATSITTEYRSLMRKMGDPHELHIEDVRQEYYGVQKVALYQMNKQMRDRLRAQSDNRLGAVASSLAARNPTILARLRTEWTPFKKYRSYVGKGWTIEYSTAGDANVLSDQTDDVQELALEKFNEAIQNSPSFITMLIKDVFERPGGKSVHKIEYKGGD